MIYLFPLPCRATTASGVATRAEAQFRHENETWLVAGSTIRPAGSTVWSQGWRRRSGRGALPMVRFEPLTIFESTRLTRSPDSLADRRIAKDPGLRAPNERELPSLSANPKHAGMWGEYSFTSRISSTFGENYSSPSKSWLFQHPAQPSSQPHLIRSLSTRHHSLGACKQHASGTKILPRRTARHVV